MLNRSPSLCPLSLADKQPLKIHPNVREAEGKGDELQFTVTHLCDSHHFFSALGEVSGTAALQLKSSSFRGYLTNPKSKRRSVPEVFTDTEFSRQGGKILCVLEPNHPKPQFLSTSGYNEHVHTAGVSQEAVLVGHCGSEGERDVLDFT